MVAVEVGWRASEQRLEALELPAQGAERALAQGPAGASAGVRRVGQLQVQPDLHPRGKQGLGIDAGARHHHADRVDRPGPGRLHDPPVVGGVVAVVVGGDDQGRRAAHT